MLDFDAAPAATHSPAHALVLGGARSGKSRHAEALAGACGRAKVYLATASACDEEMRARIARHREERAAASWRTVEEPLALRETLAREARPDSIVLVDCLTLWLSNLMLGGRDADAEARGLAADLPRLGGAVIFVSNEVGCGIVPDNPLARAFRDAQGRLNQALAQVCGHVVLLAAGLPLVLKPGPENR